MTRKIVMRKGYFWSGIIIAGILLAGYFIKFHSDSGGNYDTYDSFLGFLIFHNPFVLAFYVLIVIILVVKGLIK